MKFEVFVITQAAAVVDLYRAGVLKVRDHGPESGPPKGSQWTAEDRQSMLTKQKSRVRGPGKSLEIC